MFILRGSFLLLSEMKNQDHWPQLEVLVVSLVLSLSVTYMHHHHHCENKAMLLIPSWVLLPVRFSVPEACSVFV